MCVLNKVRWYLSETVIKVFKRLRVFGWIRFRILRYGYKFFWRNSPRNGEWDFVLGWLRPLYKWQKATVLDVGSTDSLLIYELLHRGYDVTGIDQRPYQEPNEHTQIVDVLDKFNIAPYHLKDDFGHMKEGFDYIVSVSVIEHVGLGAYQDNIDRDGDRVALRNIRRNLTEDGYFLITLPNKHLNEDSGRGYSYQDFKELIKGLYNIVYFEERSNQICAVLTKR